MKKLLSIAAILLLLFSLAGCGGEKEKYPEPTNGFFVNDFADVMSDEDETAFLTKAQALEKSTSAEVVIVTVDSLDGDEPYEYATELGTKWGVGKEQEDNGIVILLSEEDREIFIAVGYGLEGALPDSKTGRIIDVYGLSYLRNDEFSKGLLGIGTAVVNEVYIEYGLQPENGYVPADQITVQNDVSEGEVAGSWAVMFVILIIISLISRRFGWGWLFFFSPGGFSSGRSSGGGFRGGGGGFSGGGGSFGGGGAGRGF